METYNLFLDDERIPSHVTWIKLPDVEWKIVRNYTDFISTVEELGIPRIITFDHDLADVHYDSLFNDPVDHVIKYDSFSEKTGYHCAKWLVEYCDKIKEKLPEEIYIHTRNPIGAEKINSILVQGKKFLGL